MTTTHDMNALSWLLYWADVLPSLSTFVCIISFLLVCAGLFCTGVRISCLADKAAVDAFDADVTAWEAESPSTRGHRPYTYGREISAEMRSNASYAKSFWFAPYLAVVAFLSWGASFLVPEKDTFYLIAASEAGEVALRTPEAAKVRAVINKWLDEQAEPEKKAE